MRIVSFTEARSGLKSVLDQVVNDTDYTVITRRDAEDAVVMSMDHYNSLMEAVHLLKSPANAAHLTRSIEQFKSSQVISCRYHYGQQLTNLMMIGLRRELDPEACEHWKREEKELLMIGSESNKALLSDNSSSELQNCRRALR